MIGPLSGVFHHDVCLLVWGRLRCNLFCNPQCNTNDFQCEVKQLNSDFPTATCETQEMALATRRIFIAILTLTANEARFRMWPLLATEGESQKERERERES